MRKAINTEHIEGRVYQHNLVIKTVQRQDSKNYGKEFISGVLEIATDEAGLNIIPVHFTYVVEITNSGNKNNTFTNLKKIIDTDKTWASVGKEDALKVKVDTALALNDFYTQDNRQVSAKVNEGGFVTIVSELATDERERNTFSTDMVIMSTIRTEADPEKNIDKDYLTVKGLIFNFRGDILPMDFIVENEEGMDYFEGLNASQNEPVYTKVWGKITNNSISNEIVEDSAFGAPEVRTFERKVKRWVITGTAKVPYDFGDENVLTMAELEKAAQDRELMLAEKKKSAEENRASATPTAPSTPVNTATITKATFNF